MTGLLETDPFNVDGTILHIGAGQCSVLNNYFATSASHIVLVEPDPESAQALKQRAKHDSRVEVIEAAVAHQGGAATLHCYNMSGLATLHPLKTPPRQWPGLREVAKLQVKVLDLKQLIEQVALPEGKQHWLVIETPGEEKQLLYAIREQQRFAYLSLIIGSFTPQVEEVKPVLIQALEDIGYRLEHVMSQAGQLVYHTKVDKQWRTVQELKAALKKAEETNRHLKQERQSFEKLQASNSSLRQENRQLKADNEEIQQRQALLEDELRKAEVQIELIKELFLSKEDEEQLATKEREE